MVAPLSLIPSNYEDFVKDVFRNILNDKEKWHNKQKKIDGKNFAPR